MHVAFGPDESVVGVNFTYRKLKDQPFTDPLVFDGDATSAANLQIAGRRSTRADFVPATLTQTLPNGTKTTTTYYKLRSGLSSRGGSFLYNSDISSTYKGAALTFTKRLSNHWMLRGNFSYQDWVWNVPSDALAVLLRNRYAH